MALTVTLPEDLLYDLDMRVNAGEFASRDEAAAYFIRKGLERGGGRDRPFTPPPPPPGRKDPGDDRPIQVDPSDAYWVNG